ncbi:hypothetical protein [Nocardioides acrostichi]|uniref:hypothetical protein n=1 Tax=Nocardioides acrostichi TaxID=2784339 RepID=UPI001A9C46AF|nr:hypothetical protein [Nocardioides acrostichi]
MSYPQQPYVREHPEGTTILVLGILGLVLCGPFTAIPAWVKGNRVLREIDSSKAQHTNRGLVKAGQVMGIIGTVIFVGTLALYAVVFALAVSQT